MSTKISVYADRLIEAGWLIAAITVPVFFNVYSSRTFEPDKITLLRSIALVMAAAWIVKVLDEGFHRPPGEAWGAWLRGRLTGTPLALPTLLLVGAMLLSTVASISWQQSLFGSYQRLQGTYSFLSYIVIFFLAVQGLRQREQVERLVTVAIVTSIPVTLYGVLQNLGFDPLPWQGDVQRRIASTMGNSIFVAAYLIMIVPLTLGRLVQTVSTTLAADDPPTSSFLLIPFYVLVLLSQLVAIAFTLSRGPWLGLFGGIFFFILLWTFGLKRRWVVLTWVGLSLAAFAFIILLNVPNSPAAPLRQLPYLGRLGQILSDNQTGQVRVLIWRGAADLVRSDPLRTLIGYGPETMQVAYNPYYPPSLGQIESRTASPDRSHNETWDALVTTGVLGFLAYMLLFTLLFYSGLKWLGLINSKRQRNLFLGLWLGVGALVAAAFVLRTEPGYFGVALPAGMMLGLFSYLVWFALSGQPIDAAAQANPYRILLIALYAAMIAHFIEIHFGIAIAATRTYFWLFAALFVLVGELWRKRPGLAVAGATEITLPTATSSARAETRRPGKGSSTTPRRRAATPIGTPGRLPRELLAASLCLGILLAVLLFDFYAPAAGINLNWYTGWLFTFTWVFATPIILAAQAAPPRGAGEWARALGLHAAVSLSWAALYLVFHTIGFAQANAESIAWAPLPLYLYLGLSAFVLAAALQRPEPAPTRWVAGAQAIVYPALAFFIAALIWVTNTRVVSADILYKQAWVNFHQRRQYDSALRLYDDALQMQPRQDFYLLFKGKALLEKAQSTADPAQREQAFEETRRVLEQARALNPLNTDHTANLARMYQTWAGLAATPQDRDQRRAKALEYYDEAAQLSPNSVLILNQWSSAYLDAGQPDRARALLDKSLAMDDRFYDTYVRFMDLYATQGDMDKAVDAYQKAVQTEPRAVEPHIALGDLYRNRKEWDKAAEAYRKAAQISPRSAEIRSALALSLAQAGQRDAAIQENLEVLKLAPNDARTLQNLALLYRDAGRASDALAYGRRALELNPKNEGLTDFVRQLEQQGVK